MYKLITEGNHMLKSHYIADLWKFVISHPEWTYQFYLNYTPITNDEFLKLFLIKTGYTEYIFLYRSLKPKITIHQWLTTQKQ